MHENLKPPSEPSDSKWTTTTATASPQSTCSHGYPQTIQTYYDLSGRDSINRLREIVGSASHKAKALIWLHTVL